MTQDSPEYRGVGNNRRFARYLSEVAGYADEALGILSQEEMPEEEVESLSELLNPSADRMWGVKAPYEGEYLPENVRESIVSATYFVENGERKDLESELEEVSTQLSREIGEYSR